MPETVEAAAARVAVAKVAGVEVLFLWDAPRHEVVMALEEAAENVAKPIHG